MLGKRGHSASWLASQYNSDPSENEQPREGKCNWEEKKLVESLLKNSIVWFAVYLGYYNIDERLGI